MREALGFLTVLGGPHELTPRALRWFPVVGAAVGALVGVVWWSANLVFAPLLAAVLAVAADLLLTGMLHVDGLADAADGLLPHAARERRLAIMRAPDIGAYAVAVVGVVLVTRVAALACGCAGIRAVRARRGARLAASRNARGALAVARDRSRPGSRGRR
ncbi:MAG: adenosylcobinamide-GDP ribazoletransferase [Actinobacteria bacterium]|nr:MAG: adenosylcobinamide-GDP ribazoletransferase [Actinomycetota bacterium]